MAVATAAEEGRRVASPYVIPLLKAEWVIECSVLFVMIVVVAVIVIPGRNCEREGGSHDFLVSQAMSFVCTSDDMLVVTSSYILAGKHPCATFA